MVADLEEGGGDVKQQRGEPHLFALSRRLAHGFQSARRDAPAQSPDRGRPAAVSLGRGPSLHALRRRRDKVAQNKSGQSIGPVQKYMAAQWWSRHWRQTPRL